MRRGSAALVSRVLGGIVGEQERSVVDRSEPSLVTPKIFEPFGEELRILDGVLNIAVSHVELNGAGIHPYPH